ncbi:unnamed protein product, partial [Polarella glacialis]
ATWVRSGPFGRPRLGPGEPSAQDGPLAKCPEEEAAALSEQEPAVFRDARDARDVGADAEAAAAAAAAAAAVLKALGASEEAACGNPSELSDAPFAVEDAAHGQGKAVASCARMAASPAAAAPAVMADMQQHHHHHQQQQYQHQQQQQQLLVQPFEAAA